MEKHELTLYAKPDCPRCDGTGTIYNIVPYGSTTATETLDCDCPFEELDEELLDAIDAGEIEITILPAPQWGSDPGEPGERNQDE